MKIDKKINLGQLDIELNGKGLNATYDENGKISKIMLADNNDATQAQLEAAINAHIAVDPNAAKNAAQAKLAALGLTIDDLEALGL